MKLKDERHKFKVLFCSRMRDPSPNQIVISPVADGWNDFGYQIRCDFSALPGEQSNPPVLRGEIFIGFLAAQKEIPSRNNVPSNSSLRFWLERSGESDCGPEDLPEFFSMLPEMSGYREVVQALGTQKAAEFFSATRDIVKGRSSNEEWVLRALNTEVFKLGFSRNSESYYTFHNAGSILGGVELQVESTVSNSIYLSYRLEGFANNHEVNFKFKGESIIPRRINVLIGKNGTGKSQALKAFCRAAQHRDTYDDLGFSDSSGGRGMSDEGGGRPIIGRLLAIATPGETVNTFPAEADKEGGVFYRRLQITRNGRAAADRSIGTLLVRLVRSPSLLGDKGRWEIFYEAISQVMPVDDVVLKRKDGSYLPISRLARSQGEQGDLNTWASIEEAADPKMRVGDKQFPLSSGQLTFFKFSLLCALYIENGSFVLMDEPETHMHPNMIADFVGLLDTFLENTGSRAILATHSAYFVREVPREQVHVFKMGQGADREVTVDHPRLSTFGATLDSISQFVFDENVVVRLTDKIYRNSTRKGLGFDQLEAGFIDDLSLAAVMDLKRRFGDRD